MTSNVKISDMTPGAALTGPETLEMVQSGGTFSTTPNAILTFIGTQNLAFSSASKGVTFKQGANGRVGTFVANGATPVTVSNTSVAITDAIVISLNAVGGTVGAAPAIKTITAATGFTVAATAGDTSTYNYAILKNSA